MRHAFRKINKKIMIALVIIAWLFLILAISSADRTNADSVNISEKASISIAQSEKESYISSLIFC